MILVDTSVWVDHLRTGEPALVAALEEGDVWMHPFVLGELACGNLRNRATVLGLLEALPTLTPVSDAEARHFIEHRRLMGRGIGYVDVHLLAALVLAGGGHLWTRDTRLAAASVELGVAASESQRG